MSLWTPGPWRVGKAYGSVVADAPAPGIIGSDACDAYGGHLIAESVNPSNAKLIAAAPDLAALLAELVDIEGPLPGNAAWAKKVREQLARLTA